MSGVPKIPIILLIDDDPYAGVRVEEINEVVLVGGSTRIPRVRRLVSEIFGLKANGRKPHTELKAKLVLSSGPGVHHASTQKARQLRCGSGGSAA